MKSGFLTTEFWGRAIVTVMGLLVGGGVVQPEAGQKVTDLTNAAIPIVQSLIDGAVQIVGLLTAFILQLKQGQERSTLKQTAIKAAALKHQRNG